MKKNPEESSFGFGSINSVHAWPLIFMANLIVMNN